MATNEQTESPSPVQETVNNGPISSEPSNSVPESTKGKERVSPQSDDDNKSESEDSLDTTQEATQEAITSSSQSWQAIYAPQFNAYYFYDAQTGETTWTNPLQPSENPAPAEPSIGPSVGPSLASSSASPEPEYPVDSMSQYSALQAAALAQGIDPSLAHLDPSLVAATSAGPSGPLPTFQAKFNARTGAFTRPDARTPGHLSEYERMKRMSEFYFDVNAWEKQIADDKEEEDENGKKRKRPSKKDLERFKEQKRQKKIAKTAWLRT